MSFIDILIQHIIVDLVAGSIAFHLHILLVLVSEVHIQGVRTCGCIIQHFDLELQWPGYLSGNECTRALRWRFYVQRCSIRLKGSHDSHSGGGTVFHLLLYFRQSDLISIIRLVLGFEPHDLSLVHDLDEDGGRVTSLILRVA